MVAQAWARSYKTTRRNTLIRPFFLQSIAAIGCLFVSVAALGVRGSAAEPIPIGSRLELMVDDHLIDKMLGASLVLHHPAKREVAITHDAPWEGNNCGYYTVFQDGDLYRMYYMISHAECGAAERRKEPATHGLMAAYAESKDGIHWVKPNLGQVDFAGSKNNNMLAWDYDRGRRHSRCDEGRQSELQAGRPIQSRFAGKRVVEDQRAASAPRTEIAGRHPLVAVDRRPHHYRRPFRL